MRQELRTQIVQSQKLVMTQNLLQSIEMLQMNNLELAERIEQELMENPMLEIAESEDYSSGPEVKESKNLASDLDNQKGDLAWENSFNNSEQYSDYSNDDSQQYRQTSGTREDADRFQSFLEGTVSKEKSFQDALLEQVHLYYDDLQDIQTAEMVISSLDEHGFLKQTPAELGHDFADEERIRLIIDDIQTMEPVGLATTGVQQSLLVQAHQRYPGSTILHQLIKDYFLEIDQIDRAQIAKLLQCQVEDISQAILLLSTLEPYPAYQFGNAKARYVIPDLAVFRVDDQFIITINDTWLPRVQINQEYRSLIQQKGRSKSQSSIQPKDKEYLVNKMESAGWLIKGIEQRRKTLYQVMEAIVILQEDFFLFGAAHLKPLALADVAEHLDMHMSTISRSTSGKYVETHWGIFELKSFFPRSIGIEGGDSVAASEVKNDIKAMIEKEETILSDQDLVEALSQKGIKIARRTVAKYRDSLGIATASKRRRMKG